MRSRWIFVSWIILAVAATSVGCPGGVEIVDGRVTLKGIDLPEACRILQMRVTIEQGSERRIIGPFEVTADGDLEVGLVTGLDLTEDLAVTVQVAQAVGECDPFRIGRSWRFRGELDDEGTNDAGERVFTLPFSAFEEVE